MKKISWLVMAAALAAWTPARAQDAAANNAPDAELVERVNKLKGDVEDLQEKTEGQRKQIEELNQQLDSLRDQLNKPAEGAVTQDDLKKLADQLQDIDKKREADKQLILDQIKELGKVTGDTGAKSSHHKKPDETATEPVSNQPPPNPNEKGFEYQVQAGDTISVIAKAYRDKGVKVTAAQIIAANPGLKPNAMKVGQKIFIPAPADATATQ